MPSTCTKMDQQLTGTNVPDTSPQTFVPGDRLRELLAVHKAARQNEKGLACAREHSCNGGNIVCGSKVDGGARDANLYSSMDSVRRTISARSSQRMFPNQIGAERKLESGMSSEGVVFWGRIWSTGELKEMTSLESNILLCILNRLRMKCPRLFEEDRSPSGCCCCDTAGTAGAREMATKTYASSFGMFLQAQVVKSSNLARRLTLGKPKEVGRKHSTLGFARLQGEPQSFGSISWHPDVSAESFRFEGIQSSTSHEPKQDPFALLQDASLNYFMKIIQQLQVARPPQPAYPDKQGLKSVQDFLRYTESEGRRLFLELDRDNDGQVTLDDLKVAMDEMKLPPVYAKKFLARTQVHWLAKSCGWSEFSSVIQEKEPTMLRLFNSLDVTKSGTLQRTQVKDLLRNAGLPATDTNASAMLNFLGVDTEGSIKYGHFRKFMSLVPREQLAADPWRIWFKAATAGSGKSYRRIVVSVLRQLSLF